MANQERMFRVIKPTGKYTMLGEWNTHKDWTYFDEDCIKQYTSEGDIKFEYGKTIVGLEQIEKWMYNGLQPIYFTEEITPAEEILKKLIKTLDKHSIVFSEDANGNNDYEEFGFVETGFEENDFITFNEWNPTDEEIEYLKTLEIED